MTAHFPDSLFESLRNLRMARLIGLSAQFDATYYEDTYGRERPLRGGAILDYVRHGADAGHNPSSTFRADIWRTQRGLTGHSNLDCFIDYILHGEEYPFAPPFRVRVRDRFFLLRRKLLLVLRRRAYARVLQKSGFLDAAYYLATYPDVGLGSRSALEHFLAIGLEEGRYPNDRFDPVAYLLKYRDAATSALPPVIHYLCVGRNRGYTAAHGMQEVLPHFVPDSHHKLQTTLQDVDMPPPLPARRTSESGSTGKKPLQTRPRQGDWQYVLDARGTHTVKVLTPSWYFDRIASGEPLAFIKRTHGTWDILATWTDNCRRLRNLPLSTTQQRHLASRLSLYRFQAMKRDVVRFLYVDNFQNELVEDMRFATADQNYCHAIALTNVPVSPGRQMFVFYSDIYAARLRALISRLLPGGAYHDATLWKWAVCSGAIIQLNEIMRERPVFFVGLKEYGRLGERLGLPDFTHIEIPAAGAMEDRGNLLARIRTELQRKCGPSLLPVQQRPIVLICAGNLAQWLVHRLYKFAPGGVYLDVGLAYCPWLVDIYPIEQGWIRRIPAALAEKMGVTRNLWNADPARRRFYQALLEAPDAGTQLEGK